MFTTQLYQYPSYLVAIIVLISLWSVFWKGFALWFSAKNRQLPWFIFLLIFNTAGVLPIIYLIWFKPKSKKKKIVEEEFVEIIKEEPAVEIVNKPVKKAASRPVKKSVKKPVKKTTKKTSRKKKR